jgi:hypothetical protein
MLTIYTYRIPKPAECYDLSRLSLEDNFVDTILSITAHQTTGTLWFGYLDGWMLTPCEEVLLRRAIRTFNCIVVSRFPHSFSHAWKNETDRIYTVDPYNGSPYTHNDGRPLHDECKA